MTAKGTSDAKRAEVARRRERAMQLRLAGVPWHRIADELGYASKGAAATDVTRLMQQNIEAAKKAGENLLDAEIARLSAVIAALWPGAMKGNPRSAEIVLKAQERLHKITGLDAPVKVELDTGALTTRVLDLVDQVLAPASPDGR